MSLFFPPFSLFFSLFSLFFLSLFSPFFSLFFSLFCSRTISPILPCTSRMSLLCNSHLQFVVSLSPQFSHNVFVPCFPTF